MLKKNQPRHWCQGALAVRMEAHVFLKLSLKALSTFALGAAIATAASTSTQATAPSGNWNVDADPGTYTPVVLGQSITLNGCSSTFYNAANTNQSYSICDLASLSDFTLRWKASTNGTTWTWVTSTFSSNNTINGKIVTLATGAGTFFTAPGTYYIGLYLTVKNNKSILLPGGGTGYSNTDQGNKNTGTSQGFSVANPVPEPALALLLLPALAYIRRRERRSHVVRSLRVANS